MAHPSAVGTCFNLPGRFGFGRTAWLLAARRSLHARVSICQADLGLAEQSQELSLPVNMIVSICQADLGLAEPLWLAVRAAARTVSICQADLGLAERGVSACDAKWIHKFQSARQIWVWPNLAGFTPSKWSKLEFQSARQIWVWPNHRRHSAMPANQGVSICQADLGLAEHIRSTNKTHTTTRVSICQADLGLAEPYVSAPEFIEFLKFQSARQIWVWPNILLTEVGVERLGVSICQADLGLAELGSKTGSSRRTHPRFNLPGRFGFGRTSSRPARALPT